LCLFPSDDAAVVTDACDGQVVQDLTLSGDQNGSLVTVSHGATLKLSNATIRGGSFTTNRATPEVPGEALQVFGSTLEAHAKPKFFTDADNRLTDSVINGDPHFTEVVVDDVAKVLIERNQFYSGTIEMASAPNATIYDNDFRRGRVYAHFCQPASVPQMIVYHNRFYDAAQHMAIDQSGGTMLIEDNAFLTTEPDSDRCAIEVRTSWNEEPTVSVIRLNKIIGYEEGILVGEPPVQVTVEDNLILGADTGLDFRIDATVDVRDNTIRDGDISLYAWFGPKAGDPSISLRDNCIAENNWGVRMYQCGSTFPVDARENWWGDPSGPEHVDNPTGQGDRAESGVMIADWLQVDNCIADLATGVVSGTGGSVSAPGGGITVSLPPGAVPADTRVSIKSRHPNAMGTLPSGPQGLSAFRLFDVSADDQASGIPVTQLAEEGTLSVQLTSQEAAGPEPTSLGLWRLGDESLVAAWTSWDPKPTAAAGETWSLLPTEVGSDGEMLTATTEYLGTFAVLGESVAKDVYLPLVVRAASACREGDRAVER